MYYCEFENTDKVFNNKSIYRCKYCGITLALENPNANIICFKRQNEMLDRLDNTNRDSDNHVKSQFLQSEKQIPNFIQTDIIQKAQQQVINDSNDKICSKEQIDSRLAICQKCEYYKADACLLCGCSVVREQNFNNKLAHKNKACPINKWGPIND